MSAGSAGGVKLLEVRQLRYTFDTGLNAVDGVDVDVDVGARLALIGCNGAGKTTLLNLLSGTLRPDAGSIRLNGETITRTSATARSRKGIARTFQTPAVFHTLSVKDNVILNARPHVRGHGLRPGRRRRLLQDTAMEQLARLGMADHAEVTVSALSHGQRRLTELASTLVTSPRLLLLDEPAAGLTDEDLDYLSACLQRLPETLAMVFVEHYQAMVHAIAESVTVLHHGQVLTSGTPQEISAHPRVAEVYLGERTEPAHGG